MFSRYEDIKKKKEVNKKYFQLLIAIIFCLPDATHRYRSCQGGRSARHKKKERVSVA